MKIYMTWDKKYSKHRKPTSKQVMGRNTNHFQNRSAPFWCHWPIYPSRQPKPFSINKSTKIYGWTKRWMLSSIHISESAFRGCTRTRTRDAPQTLRCQQRPACPTPLSGPEGRLSPCRDKQSRGQVMNLIMYAISMHISMKRKHIIEWTHFTYKTKHFWEKGRGL